MGQRLSWEEIRRAFPNRFVLLADCQESRAGDIVTVLEAEVLDAGPDGGTIFQRYRVAKQGQDVLFGYTGWERFEIEVRPFLGIRPAHG